VAATELRAVATKYKQELRSGIAERFSPQGERSANWRRNQYKAADTKRSLVGWCILREMVSALDRKK